MKGLSSYFPSRRYNRPLPKLPNNANRMEGRGILGFQYDKWSNRLPSLTTTHATALTTCTWVPSLLASADWNSPFALPQLRNKTIMAFQTTPTSHGYHVPALKSPYYTLMTYPFYHPKVWHVLLYGSGITYHAMVLNRGFWSTLSTWCIGAMSYMGGTLLYLCARPLWQSSTYSSGSVSSWLSKNSNSIISSSSSALTTTLSTSINGLQQRWGVQTLYGMRGVMYHFQFAFLTRQVRILKELFHILHYYPKLSSQRRILVQREIRRQGLQLGISALFFIPELLQKNTSHIDGEWFGLLAAAVSGCISSYSYERYLTL